MAVDEPSARDVRKARSKAFALKHDIGGPQAPRVVAKGFGKLADKILQVAFAHGVKVRQDPDLAEILTIVELESQIPVEAFSAVAEILAYVYQVNGRVPAARS